MRYDSKKTGVPLESLFEMVDQLHDEILIYDDNYQIVYINQASRRHYNFTPEQMVGRSFFEFVDADCWNNSILPVVYKEKKPYAARQKTHMGTELFTIAYPFFDKTGKMTHVIMNVRDNAAEVPIYNPDYSFKADRLDNVEVPIAFSEQMRYVIKLAGKMSQVEMPCLITGESGTGKTMLARYIHAMSPRNEKPFISINCASIPDALVESELFGYEKGAFTGANAKGKKGLFEAAHGGTLLLDEIGELPLAAQSKLLQVLQDKSYLPVGGDKKVQVDARILAATNQDLKEMIRQGRFREDLYYRLNVVEIVVPSLRERRNDIPELITYFMKKYNQQYNLHKAFSSEALQYMFQAEWKGNIRELSHMIERLMIITDDDVVDASQLPNSILGVDDKKVEIGFKEDSIGLDERVAQYEGSIVRDAYEKYHSSRKLAKYLGISQTRANKMIQKYITDKENKE